MKKTVQVQFYSQNYDFAIFNPKSYTCLASHFNLLMDRQNSQLFSILLFSPQAWKKKKKKKALFNQFSIYWVQVQVQCENAWMAQLRYNTAHQRSKLNNYILGTFSRVDKRVWKCIPFPNGLGIVQLANWRKVCYLSIRFSIRWIQSFVEMLTDIVSDLSFQNKVNFVPWNFSWLDT